MGYVRTFGEQSLQVATILDFIWGYHGSPTVEISMFPNFRMCLRVSHTFEADCMSRAQNCLVLRIL
jgi:hypothetical protein